MNTRPNKPKLGLALSGSGNRSSFYIGFLEVLKEQNIELDYIAASSGAALVAAAYACGTLEEFKKTFAGLNKEVLKTYIIKGKGRGGFYTLGLVEQEMRRFTKGLRFEDVRPLMGFITVDIENGEQVVLSMGDIAHAACASCTLPGVFEPVKWGDRVLVDGGLSSIVPTDVLDGMGMDVTIGINMRGTKHIFASRYLTMRSLMNRFKKLIFWDEMEEAYRHLWEDETLDYKKPPGIFTVLGKSLDWALEASKRDLEGSMKCDLMITPDIPLHNRKELLAFSPYYELGRQVAQDHIPAIKNLITNKEKVIA